MKNNYPFYLWILLFLSSCAFQLPFNKVHSGYDDFKKEKINYYRYTGKARPLLFRSGGYITNLDFKHIEAEYKTKNTMVLFLNLNPEKIISDSVYVKIKEQIFPLKAYNLIKSPVRQSETEVETKVKTKKNKDDNDDGKQTVTTSQSSNTYEYIHTSLFFRLPDKMISDLKHSDTFSLRFYVDDQPYTININRHKLIKVKKVFGINEVAD